MIISPICDACGCPLRDRTCHVQAVPGRVVVTPNGVEMRREGSPEAYILCNECAAVVTDALHRLVRNREHPVRSAPTGQ